MKLLYFAWVREAVGCGEMTVELPVGVVTVSDLADWLTDRHAVFADRHRLRVAVDQTMADWQTNIEYAREVAFFPPVTGG